MTLTERIEDLIRNAKVTTSATSDERIIAAVEAATTKQNEQYPASVRTGGAIRRIIMKSNWTKLATAATIIIAIGLGMYALTGSGTSITMAQVKQAMENIDWVQIVVWSEDESMTSWYSFASKVAITIQSNGRILYRDFNAGKRLVWNPGGEYIYESPIEEGREFAGGVSNIYAGFTKMFDSIEAKGDYNVTKEIGTYQGQKVEIWTGRRIKGEPGPTHTELFTFYIDVEKKLPMVATDVKKGADGDIQLNVEFKYPKTGPADIYEAGAPRSAQIKPALDQ
ncbi:MAG: hypothetical protein ACYSWW_19585 [Planctomycetota bacterium]|jgi:hypothetical protein